MFLLLLLSVLHMLLLLVLN